MAPNRRAVVVVLAVCLLACSGCGLFRGGLVGAAPGPAPTYIASIEGLPQWDRVGPVYVLLWIPAGGGQGDPEDKPWTTHTDLQYDGQLHRWTTGIFNGFYEPSKEGFYKSREDSGSPAGTYDLIPESSSPGCPDTIQLYGSD